MAQLTELKRELKFSTEMLQLIQTLKNVAASQYHALEHEKERFEEFMLAFQEFFRVVDRVGVHSPLVQPATDVLGVVAVTSDSGFMGGLNAGVIDRALEEKGDRPETQMRWVVVGEKGAGLMQEGAHTFQFFRGIVQETRYEQAVEIGRYLVKEVLEKRMGRVVIVHPHPVSFTQQTVGVVSLLPCGELFERKSEEEDEDKNAAAVRAAGGLRAFLARSRDVVVESSFDDMVKYLAEVWLGAKLYEVFEDSKLSEYAARAMHLEDSVQKLEKDLKQLKHRVFRATHELVDKGMRESFGSRKKKKRRAA